MRREEDLVGETFEFKGFNIPVELAILTGGGPDTWDGISHAHIAAYERYSPICPGQYVLEVGCGVGRDAIPLAEVLGSNGSYLGLDIHRPSIEWCQEHISKRFPFVRFTHLDIHSPFYNPSGTLSAVKTRIPVRDNQVDRIVLQSVFTHMFEEDIVHFLTEFERVLRPRGLVFASFFVVDDETKELTLETNQGLTFGHLRGDGCWVNELNNPEGAVAYAPSALDRMLQRSGLELSQPVHRGSWSGRPYLPDGQDIAILRRRSVNKHEPPRELP